MATAAQKFLGAGALASRAQKYAGQMLGPLTHQSLPIVASFRGTSTIAFMFCRAEIVDAGSLTLWAPRYVAYLNPADGALRQIQAVTPEALGLKTKPDEPIGSYLTPGVRMSEKFLTSLGQFFEGFDAVVPGYLDRKPVHDPDVKAGLTKMLETWPQLAEKPLLPCYRQIASEFVNWAKLPV
jgi:hypothetical protein